LRIAQASRNSWSLCKTKVVTADEFDNSVTPLLDHHLSMIRKQHILDRKVRIREFILSLSSQAKKMAVVVEDGIKK
jgi:hypothetical protein